MSCNGEKKNLTLMKNRWFIVSEVYKSRTQRLWNQADHHITVERENFYRTNDSIGKDENFDSYNKTQFLHNGTVRMIE